MYMNEATIMGHIGKEPEIRTTSNGKKMAMFSVATSEYWKDKSGENQTQTQWHNIVAWGANADVAEKFLKKGMNIVVKGKITYNTYQDKAGENRTATQIVVEKIIFSFKQFKEMKENDEDGSESHEREPAEKPKTKKPGKQSKEVKINEDELPF